MNCSNLEFGNKNNAHNLKYYNPYDTNIINDISPILGELKEFGRNDGLVKGVVRVIVDGVVKESILENIVVSPGRRFVAQRLFDTNHPADLDVREFKITHFGLGSGGAITSGAYTNLIGPNVCDRDLYSPIKLTGNPIDPLFLTSPGDDLRGIDPTPYCIKPIKPSGMIDVILTNDIECDFGPVYSYVRCVCVKSMMEPNYLIEDDDYIMINEAMLYYSDGHDCHSFAHICFPPKYILKRSEFVVEWYILC